MIGQTFRANYRVLVIDITVHLLPMKKSIKGNHNNNIMTIPQLGGSKFCRQLTIFGLLSCTMDCFRFVRGPSTKQPFSLKCESRLFHSGCLLSTRGLPRMMSPYLARVSATLRRRGSDRKPMDCCSLERTQDSTMMSFSRPWNASTLDTWYGVCLGLGFRVQADDQLMQQCRCCGECWGTLSVIE